MCNTFFGDIDMNVVNLFKGLNLLLFKVIL